MLKLFIDGHQADIETTSEVLVSLSAASFTQTSSWGRAGYSKSITIPATPLNRRLMGDCESPLVVGHFNHVPHTARVEWGGSTIIEGSIYLTACRLGREGYYKFNIIGNAREWVRSAHQPLAALPIDYAETFSAEEVAESIEAQGDRLVRWLPVERLGHQSEGEGALRRLLPTDHHPFLHIGTLVERIFASADYQVESKFLAGEFFRSLYMSGSLAERFAAEEVAAEGDFRAVRTADSEPQSADVFGRVWADHLANYHTVGNLVDSTSEEVGGYNRGDSFGTDSTGRIRFRPCRDVAVAFDVTVRYRTDYRILSRHELVGFDTIRPTWGDTLREPLENRFDDNRGTALQAGYDYTLLIFDHPADGSEYRLVGYEQMSDGTTTERILCHTTSRATTVNTSHQNVSNLKLQYLVAGEPYDSSLDWALYDGYVTEHGTTERTLTLRTLPIVVEADEELFFDLFYIGGAEQGQTLTLLAGTSLTPVFYSVPLAEGGEFEWADVVPKGVTQMQLLEALRDLFDLQIYTDPSLRRVFIEPRCSFHDTDRIISLAGRTLNSSPIEVEELGFDAYATEQVAYRGGDAAVAERAEGWDEWQASVANIFASEGVRRRVNSLFAPSVEVAGTIPSAPSAHLVAVGDEGAGKASNHLFQLNFTTKIISYGGPCTLPEGQEWPWPIEGATTYPRLDFFAPAEEDDEGGVAREPLSLRMADCNGVAGLGSSYHQSRINTLNHSRRLTLGLIAYPEEVASLMTPTSVGWDFRALFLVDVAGEQVLCRLEAINDYNPATAVASATFVTV